MKLNFFEIPIKWDMSSKMTNAVQQKIYESDINKYGQPQSYSLQIAQSGYILAPNHKCFSLQRIENKNYLLPKNGSYIFVVIRDPNHASPQIRISQGSHYFLADRAISVYAAGEITFENHQIIAFNDQSGSYHLHDPDPLTLVRYLASLESVMTAVRVPFDKYVPYTAPSKTESYHSRFGLFNRENVMLACAGVAGLVIYHNF